MSAVRAVAWAAALGAVAYIVYKVARAGGNVSAAVADTGRSIAAGAARVAAAVDPTNPGNVFAATANTVTQAVTGDASTSLGSKLYDLFNPGDKAGAIAIAPTGGARVTADLGVLDREDSDLGYFMRLNAANDALEAEDAQLGAAMRFNLSGAVETAGGAYIGYPQMMRR